MKNQILIICGIVALIIVFAIKKQSKKTTNAGKHLVGIVQTASHPALDAVRDGFIQELKKKSDDTIEFVIQNAQGSITQAHTIAQQFHANQEFQGFLAIATPAAQAISSLEKERPIFIAAVTDPGTLGKHDETTNLCGTTDMINVQTEVDMLITLLPEAKTIGLIYTSGETNSLALVKKMRLELEKRGLKAVDFAISNEADLPALVNLACRKTDAILAPTDNTVASSITLISNIALNHKKPLIVSDNMLVTFGPLAARGVDYRESGKQTGHIAYEVLIQGKKPTDLPIEQTKSEKIYINQTTVALLGLTIPDSLKPHLILVS